jgi:hypothetical protein
MNLTLQITTITGVSLFPEARRERESGKDSPFGESIGKGIHTNIQIMSVTMENTYIWISQL